MENLGDILKRLDTARRDFPDALPPDISENGSGECGICRGRGWFTSDVPAGDPDFGRIFACGCRQDRLERERSDRLLRYSNLGRLTRFTFETLSPDGQSELPKSRQSFRDAHETARAFAAEPRGWLVFTGPHGSGKTHLAAAIANRCIEKGRPALFVHVPDLLDHLRAGFSPTAELSYDNLYEQVTGAPLLVLDGLGAQSSTPWAQEKLQQVINHRYNAELPTVVTTALSLDEIDPYVRSRLEAPELSTIVPVGADERQAVTGQGGIDPAMARRMTFESFDVRGNNPTAQQRASLESAFEAARNFAADPHGWLTLFGETGTGKTHLAVAIAVERIARGHPVWFAFVPDLMDYLRSTFSPDSAVTYDRAFDEIKNADLLILDDVGRAQASSWGQERLYRHDRDDDRRPPDKRGSPWAQEKLYQIVVNRHNGRLPTVITSPLDFEANTGPISSRIRDPYVGQLVRVDAPDYRIKDRHRRGPGR